MAENKTLYELDPDVRKKATAAYNASHGHAPDYGFAPDRAWIEGWAFANETFEPVPQAQAQADDSALLDAMEQKRISVVPEYEGPWDAEIYNGNEKPNHRGTGSTPREAIRAAIAASKEQP